MRIHRSRPLTRAVVALAGASLFATACGAGGSNDDEGSGGGEGGSASEVEGDTTGITDSSIKIGTHKPLTGVAAPGYSEIPTGAQAYFDYVNAAGGVCERDIEYIVRDDGYNPTNTSQVTNQLVLQDEIFAMMGGLGTPTHSAVVDYLNEEQVPDLFVASGALAWDDPEGHPYTFGWQPDYTVEGKVMGTYIKEKYPNAKIGLFLQADDFGRDGGNGLKQFVGNQVVKEVTYTPTQTDISSQITQLKAAGADLVVGFNTPTWTALTQLQGLAQGFKPQWFYSGVGLDPQYIGGLLATYSKGSVKDAGPLEGAITTAYLSNNTQTSDPWVQLWSKVWQAKGNGKPFSNYHLYGMASAYTVAQQLAAGGKDLSRESLVKAIEDKGDSFKGPALAPYAYSADSHRGISGVKLVQVTGGALTDVTKVQTTGDGDDPVKDYTGSASTPPANGVPTG